MYVYQFIKTFSVFLLFVASAGLFANELTLVESEQIALDSDFLTKEYQALSESLKERAIAEGQLPDPKIKFGVMNIPVNSFDRSQENMTQLQVGLQQSFPRGRTLHYKKLQVLDISDVDEAKAFDQARKVLRSVRNSYFDLYLNVKTESILLQNRDLFTKLFDTTQRQYAVGRDNQHDVLRAQLELALIDDRIAEVNGAKEIALGELARWVGNEQAQRPLSQTFPTLTAVPSVEQMLAALPSHPLLQMEDARVRANDKDVNIAEEQYKPGWMLDFTYGERTGNNMDGSSRDDFASAMVTMDIPIFTDKRQDKRLASRKLELAASRFARSDRLIELKKEIEIEHANWVRQGKRLELYETRAVVDAAQNSESTLKAYQNDLTDFTTLMRARLTELNTQIDMLRIRISRAKSQANLLYFSGENL